MLHDMNRTSGEFTLASQPSLFCKQSGNEISDSTLKRLRGKAHLLEVRALKPLEMDATDLRDWQLLQVTK